ncbi:cystathionine beta-lyase [uncultured Cohaesibacter sp.]|uniref:cystathionine beta-lyase n=1 Tax=uncultured Cohaesibacter sp. TaxID=1002546 RepID=UPI0029C68033|nr:cystathionine beta-lyase [uncultured Cohaesibacter sp.]
MSDKHQDKKSFRKDTQFVLSGRSPSDNHGFVNPPVVHGSTVVFEKTDDLYMRKVDHYYGRRTSPTINALTDALTELEGAFGSVLAPSGLAAVSIAMLSAVKTGEHILITDSAYEPARHFADTILVPMGVDVEYYDPLIGGDIAKLFKDNTVAVYTESPGSETFEVQDIPAIVAAAHARDILVVLDNTWGTQLFFDALGHGVDIVLTAGTKYIVGHSDAMLGTVSANEKCWPRLQEVHGAFGYHVGPDDIYLALRGLRTMTLRLRHHQQSALEIARWLEARPEVERVLHPGLESHPGHAIWKRDFTGSCGLFGVVLKDSTVGQARAMIDAMELFGFGFSWGGYESLVTNPEPKMHRSATSWDEPNAMLRLHVGLEDVEDLKADLERGFAAFAAAAR